MTVTSARSLRSLDRDPTAPIRNLDWALLGLALVLNAIGAAMIYSATKGSDAQRRHDLPGQGDPLRPAVDGGPRRHGARPLRPHPAVGAGHLHPDAAVAGRRAGGGLQPQGRPGLVRLRAAAAAAVRAGEGGADRGPRRLPVRQPPPARRAAPDHGADHRGRADGAHPAPARPRHRAGVRGAHPGPPHRGRAAAALPGGTGRPRARSGSGWSSTPACWRRTRRTG